MAKTVFAAILLSLFLSALPASSVTATEGIGWCQQNTPLEGEAGGWLLAEGSDIRCLAVAGDGSLYAAIDGLEYTLFRSADGGYSWSPAGGITDAIVDIEADAVDESIVYCATRDSVYKSNNGGDSFLPLAANPALTGGYNLGITDIDVARWEGGKIIIAATRDTDAGEYGGVYMLNEGAPFSQWQDTGIGGYDVYAVALSPGFADDQQMVAVVNDESETIVINRIGNAGWGETIGVARLEKDNSGDSLAELQTAAIAFPDDYNSNPDEGSYAQFVAIDGGFENGDVYAVYGRWAPAGSLAEDLNIGSDYGLDNVDVAGLAVCGGAESAYLLAGSANCGQVYHSYDGGYSWTESIKEPTGQHSTLVLMAPDFLSQSVAYAATSGANSALSFTRDGGFTWNQIGLIDSRIEAIVDLAVSPDYEQDGTLFVLTWGGDFSLWRGNGDRWERVFGSSPADIECIDFVGLSPQYGGSSRTVYLAGCSNGLPVVWRSEDDGQGFICRSAPIYIDCWAVADDDMLFIAGYDGSHGIIYKTTNGGRNYSTGVATGSQSIISIALSPDYRQDETVLVSNSYGGVYLSDDGGKTFEASPSLVGSISVAFDPQFGDNNTIYATSDSPDGGIYRLVIGGDWEAIDDTLPLGGMVNALGVSEGGVLYAANFQQVDIEDNRGGMERCLEPASAEVFETVTAGLEDGATLIGLWLCDNRLWSIDTTNLKVMVFTDTLAQPVSLVSPFDRATGTGTVDDGVIGGIRLDWQPLAGATRYQWQLSDSDDFSSVTAEFDGTTGASSVSLPELETDSTYYWRVRACQPLLGCWSAAWSFTTSLDGGSIAAPLLESPEDGAVNVPLNPLFQWSAVAGADGYELVASEDIDYDMPVLTAGGDYTLSDNAWQPDVNLLYDTTYYWKVRAVNGDDCSDWSRTAAFTTEAEPETPPPTSTPPGQTTTLTPISTLPAVTITTQTPPTAIQLTSTTATQKITETPPETQSTSTLISSTEPVWLRYIIGGMGGVIAVLLISVLVLMLRRRSII